VFVPRRIIVFINVCAREAGEPLVQFRRPLTSTAGIGGCDQAERSEIECVFFTFTNVYD